MSKQETKMIRAYWKRIGGTLIEEFQMVEGDSSCGRRRADALIIPAGECLPLPRGKRNVNIEGKDVIVVQAKKYRLGMYLMGQGVFSAKLIERLKPKSVKSVILCVKDDTVLRPLLAPFPNVEVITMPEQS